MTKQHYQPGTESRIRCLVIHATAGRYPGDYNWLRQGGDPARPISCHYYITKTGGIYQFVHDANIAWHAGVSTWLIDGRKEQNINRMSVGIELENLNTGTDPYPESQIAATIALSRYLVYRYHIPITQVVRHCDISPGRKSDPVGLHWPSLITAIFQELPSAPHEPYTEDTPLLSVPLVGPGLAERVQALCCKSPYASERERPIINVIVPRYIELCSKTGLNVYLVLAQMLHETGYLTSALSQRKDKDGRDLRNPAGIGVWEARDKATAHWRPGTVYDSDCKGYRPCVQFRDWHHSAIPAHVGRLIAWCVPLARRSVIQRDLAKLALAYRPLDIKHHGSVYLAKELGKAHNATGAGWASPGHTYGAALARIANTLRQIY